MTARPFTQTMIYDLLERHGPLRVKEIYGRLGMEYQYLSNALQDMRAKGSVTHTGKGKATRWAVTTKHPVDMRGRTLGSQLALRKSRANCANLWNCWSNGGRVQGV